VPRVPHVHAARARERGSVPRHPRRSTQSNMSAPRAIESRMSCGIRRPSDIEAVSGSSAAVNSTESSIAPRSSPTLKLRWHNRKSISINDSRSDAEARGRCRLERWDECLMVFERNFAQRRAHAVVRATADSTALRSAPPAGIRPAPSQVRADRPLDRHASPVG